MKGGKHACRGARVMAQFWSEHQGGSLSFEWSKDVGIRAAGVEGGVGTGARSATLRSACVGGGLPHLSSCPLLSEEPPGLLCS